MTPVDREASDAEEGEDQFYDADGVVEAPHAPPPKVILPPTASEFEVLHAQLSPLAQSTSMLHTRPTSRESTSAPASSQPLIALSTAPPVLPAAEVEAALNVPVAPVAPSDPPVSRTASPFKEGSTLDPLSHHIRHRRRQASVASLGALGAPGEPVRDGDSTDDESSTQQSHATSAAMGLFAGLKRRAKHVMEGRDAVQNQDADERYIKVDSCCFIAKG